MCGPARIIFVACIVPGADGDELLKKTSSDSRKRLAKVVAISEFLGFFHAPRETKL
jgi:hypothetical protein